MLHIRRFWKGLSFAVVGLAAVLAAAACDGPVVLPTVAPSPTAIATATLLPTVTPTFTPIPAATATVETVTVPRLRIAPVSDGLPDYDRKEWRHWVDADRDCQNTRAEVLIAEAAGAVTFAKERECAVAGGKWVDPFTGETFTEAGRLDVDHLVPLANAHRSGGWRWAAARKRDFANSLEYANHLIAVSASANRAKGARGPEDWRPPDVDYHCQYARDWIAVKAEWDLTATAAEWAALAEMLGECPYAVAFGDGY